VHTLSCSREVHSWRNSIPNPINSVDGSDQKHSLNLMVSGCCAGREGSQPDSEESRKTTPCDGLRVLDLVAETRTGIDHLDWLDDIKPKAKVPMVDTSVRQSR
jgi:hypothetical protein